MDMGVSAQEPPFREGEFGRGVNREFPQYLAEVHQQEDSVSDLLITNGPVALGEDFLLKGILCAARGVLQDLKMVCA